jgi:hypothetical protein
VVSLVGLLLLVEFMLVDMGLSKAMVPGEWLHAVDDDNVLAEVSVHGGVLVNELLIRVADVVGLEKLEHVEVVEEHWDDVLEDSLENSVQLEAGSFSSKAPVLDVITNLSELAGIFVFPGHVKESLTSTLPVFIGDVVHVVVLDGINDFVDWLPGWDHPLTEAFIVDESGFSVQSFDTSDMCLSDEFSPEESHMHLFWLFLAHVLDMSTSEWLVDGINGMNFPVDDALVVFAHVS